MQVKTVEIPGCEMHEGFYRAQIRLNWVCPQCGGDRGEIYRTFSYDGSRRLVCDGWKNLCGHVDLYSDVRKEAVSNRLN